MPEFLLLHKKSERLHCKKLTVKKMNVSQKKNEAAE